MIILYKRTTTMKRLQRKCRLACTYSLHQHVIWLTQLATTTNRFRSHREIPANQSWPFSDIKCGLPWYSAGQAMWTTHQLRRLCVEYGADGREMLPPITRMCISNILSLPFVYTIKKISCQRGKLQSCKDFLWWLFIMLGKVHLGVTDCTATINNLLYPQRIPIKRLKPCNTHNKA